MTETSERGRACNPVRRTAGYSVGPTDQEIGYRCSKPAQRFSLHGGRSLQNRAFVWRSSAKSIRRLLDCNSAVSLFDHTLYRQVVGVPVSRRARRRGSEIRSASRPAGLIARCRAGGPAHA